MPLCSVAEAPSAQRSPESSPPKVPEVFLAGRTPTSVEAVAKQIEAAGRRTHADVVDALDGAAVEETSSPSFSTQGAWTSSSTRRARAPASTPTAKHAADLRANDFMVPADTVLRAQFITAAAAARQMLRQGSGVIIFLTGGPARRFDEMARWIGRRGHPGGPVGP
jgi:3-oxoacyl-[acyl-carrier protein] reductase